MLKRILTAAIILQLSLAVARVYLSPPSSNMKSIIYTSSSKDYPLSHSIGYISGDSGLVLKTTNGGVNWLYMLVSTNQNLNSIFFLNPDSGWAAGDSGRIFRSSTGNTWTPQTSDVTTPLNSIYFVHPDSGWVAGDGGKVLRTVNGGTLWTTLVIDAAIQFRSIFFKNQQGWVMGTSGKVYHTTNGGTAWTVQATGTGLTLNSVFFLDYNTGYCAGESGVVLKTVNSGTTWTLLVSGTLNILNSGFFTSVSTGYIVGAGGKIIKTTDGGVTFGTLSGGTSKNLTSVYFSTSDTGTIVGSDSLIIKTTDGGASWFNQYLSGYYIGINKNYEIIPKEFHLYQNYPNPFNPSTTIKFDIPTSPLSLGEGLGVRLLIYDLLGREITTLVNETLKPGTYEVEWKVSNSPSGVYFYKLTTGDFTETKKMLLIK